MLVFVVGCVGFGTWFVLSVVKQFRPIRPRAFWLENFTFIPRWWFFKYNFDEGEFRISVRYDDSDERTRDATPPRSGSGEWEVVEFPHAPLWRQWIWNPEMRVNKELWDACARMCALPKWLRFSKNFMPSTVAYKLLLAWVCRDTEGGPRPGRPHADDDRTRSPDPGWGRRRAVVRLSTVLGEAADGATARGPGRIVNGHVLGLESFRSLSDAATAARVATVLVGLGSLVNVLQQVGDQAAYARHGMLGWETIGRSHHVGSRQVGSRTIAEIAFSAQVVAVLAGVEVLAACVLVAGRSSRLLVPALATVLVARAYHYGRDRFGFEGADQMRLIVLAGLLWYELTAGTRSGEIALVFIGAECILAYLTAGVVKVRDKDWRNGRAMADTLRSEMFGRNPASALLLQAGLAPVLASSMLGFECAAWVLLFGGPVGICAYVAIAGAFHVTTAVVMGLDRFVWVFGAALPCVAFTALRFFPHLG